MNPELQERPYTAIHAPSCHRLSPSLPLVKPTLRDRPQAVPVRTSVVPKAHSQYVTDAAIKNQ